MFSRRMFLRAGAGVAMTGGLIGLNRDGTAQEDGPRIGDSRAAFESWFGRGVEEASADGTLWTTWGEGAPNSAKCSVLFNEQNLAESICTTFRFYDNAGLEPDGEIGQTRFLRTDANQDVTTYLGPQNVSDISWAVTQWHSPSLASDLGRSGNVIVMDKIVLLAEVGFPLIQETFVSMESFEVAPLEGNGANLGSHNSVEDWEAYSGVSRGDGGLEFTNGYQPGEWTVNPGSIVIYPQPMLTAAQSRELVASMLPVTSTLWTAHIPANPLTADGTRIHGFSTAYGLMVTCQWGTSDELSDTPQTSRIGLGAFDHQYHLSH